jgi:hypothetical protein
LDFLGVRGGRSSNSYLWIYGACGVSPQEIFSKWVNVVK